MKEAKLINKAIKEIKSFSLDWKLFDHDDWYGELESMIDAMSEEFGLNDEDDDYELELERLVFDGIKKAMKGQRHKCDPYYDEAFDGWDCMSKRGER